MKELKPNPVEGPALSDEVYALALARIDAVMGCTEDSPEEAELVLWAGSPTRTNERPGPSTPTLRASPSTSRRVTKNSPPRPKLGGLRLHEGLPAKWRKREGDR